MGDVGLIWTCEWLRGKAMSGPFDTPTRRAIKTAIARDAYGRDEVRIADSGLAGYRWLVASNRGLFAVAPEGSRLAVHGWFYGLCRHGDTLYCYENCGLRDRSAALGRIVAFDLAGERLAAPRVLVKGLHTNCHQLAVIDGLLCLLDTNHQAILRFTLDGAAVDVLRPFPPALPTDTSGAYLHINSIAKVGDDRIGIMLHNGKAIPQKQSEIAWLDADWRLLSRETVEGHCCHDIAQDEAGVLWHSASMSGEIMSSDGRRARITDRLMTRGIAVTSDAIIVGISTFGPRQIRDALGGGVVILDRQLNHLTEMELEGSPTDIISLQEPTGETGC